MYNKLHEQEKDNNNQIKYVSFATCFRDDPSSAVCIRIIRCTEKRVSET